jgi:hypothetical protein
MIWKEGFAGVYFEEASYVEFPEPEELVYHMVNGELRELSEPVMEMEREYIIAFRVPARARALGHWQCRVFRAGDRYYLEMEWIPQTGYSWEERVVYRLKRL